MLVPYQKKLRPRSHLCEERIAGAELLGELARRVDGRVDRPTKLALRRRQGGDRFPEADTADDHDVDVAVGPVLSGDDTAIDKCHLDAPKTRESLPEFVHETDGLHDQRAEVREQRVRWICFVPHLVAGSAAGQQPRARELLEFPLDVRRAPTGEADQFIDVEVAIGPPE